MRQSLLYFVAAALFAVATGLNLFNQGPNLKTALGLILAWAMTMFALRLRRFGRTGFPLLNRFHDPVPAGENSRAIAQCTQKFVCGAGGSGRCAEQPLEDRVDVLEMIIEIEQRVELIG